MIPKETLIATIEKFDKKLKEIDLKCKNGKQGDSCFLTYFEMSQAWSKFQDSVEYSLLPFIK
jgi:hypothetical protein